MHRSSLPWCSPKGSLQGSWKKHSREAGKNPPGKLEKTLHPVPHPVSFLSPLSQGWEQIHASGTDCFPEILQASGHRLPEPVLRGCFHPWLNLSGFGDCRIRQFCRSPFPPWKSRGYLAHLSELPLPGPCRVCASAPSHPGSSPLWRGREKSPPFTEKKGKKTQTLSSSSTSWPGEEAIFTSLPHTLRCSSSKGGTPALSTALTALL